LQQAIACESVDGCKFDQDEGFTYALAFTAGFGTRGAESQQ
jgi:hypothetical protein